MPQTVFEVTIGQCVASDRNLACAVLTHQTLLKVCLMVNSMPQSVCSYSNCTFCPTVVRQCLIVKWGLSWLSGVIIFLFSQTRRSSHVPSLTCPRCLFSSVGAKFTVELLLFVGARTGMFCCYFPLGQP